MAFVSLIFKSLMTSHELRYRWQDLGDLNERCKTDTFVVAAYCLIIFQQISLFMTRKRFMVERRVWIWLKFKWFLFVITGRCLQYQA